MHAILEGIALRVTTRFSVVRSLMITIAYFGDD